MKVLDSGALIEGAAGEGVTAPGVALETRVPLTVKIIEPKQAFMDRVGRAARETGDLDVLSQADKEVLALALQLNAELVSNDYAVQNVASRLGVEWQGTRGGMEREIEWEWFCPACGRTYGRKQACSVCGTETKRRPRRADKTL